MRQSLESTETPALSCLLDGTLVNWNSGAERIFGFGAAEALHRKCYEVVAGLDIFGNDYCVRHCPVRDMARRNRPVQPFHMCVCQASGERLTVRTLVLVVGGREAELVHLFDPLTQPSQTPGFQAA